MRKITYFIHKFSSNYWETIEFVFTLSRSTVIRILLLILSSAITIFSLDYANIIYIDNILSKIICSIFAGFFIPFLVMPFYLTGKIITLQKKHDEKIKLLQKTIDHKKAKDELSLKLQALLNNYNETAGLNESYGIFHNGIVSAMEESGIISESEIFELKNSFPPCHVLKNECIKIISKLKY